MDRRCGVEERSSKVVGGRVTECVYKQKEGREQRDGEENSRGSKKRQHMCRNALRKSMTLRDNFFK